MTAGDASVICCNGAPAKGFPKHQRLEYRAGMAARNVTVDLPAFVRDVFHIPPRTLDLLEIAAYVFAADRLTSRGPRDLVEFHTWARSFRFRVRVRDFEFWSDPKVRDALSEALKFMTGDELYEFDFFGGHSTHPTSLFDVEGHALTTAQRPLMVTLFSGGLDSLAGAVTALSVPDNRLILVSHQSQTGTMRTQNQLAEALRSRFGKDRVSHYKFQCHLSGKRAQEETQRTRFFLYSTIGFAIANAYGLDSFYVCENGVTSINLRRREDLANARASRTTHPLTAQLMSRLFSLVSAKPFSIDLPLIWRSKAAVIRSLEALGNAGLIASSVTCSRTYQRSGDATHCGWCFQCIDRRMAIHAAGLERYDDAGLYAHDIILNDIEDPEARTTTVDYIRQAQRFANGNIDSFEAEYLSELPAIADGLSSTDELEIVGRVWELMKEHGENVNLAIRRMRELHDDPFQPLPRRSLLGLLADREFLKPEVARAVESIVEIVRHAIPEMFRDHRPKDEPDLNRKIGALLRTHEPKLTSEHPTVPFARARVVPDHELDSFRLLIESKYVRKNTPPSKASEGMAADLTKYPSSAHI
ncbi:MAG: 7-cyano-7-deazaguanine synthase, partial [Gemmatimonadota bacterium]|nr:7-cyano-7-deazaguanine synthase [Gemmatimonadota bacterium]